MKIVNIRLTDEIFKRVQNVRIITPYKTIHGIIMEAIDNGLKLQEKKDDS